MDLATLRSNLQSVVAASSLAASAAPPGRGAADRRFQRAAASVDARGPLEPVLAQVVHELRLASPGRVIEPIFAIDSLSIAIASGSASSFPPARQCRDAWCDRQAHHHSRETRTDCSSFGSSIRVKLFLKWWWTSCSAVLPGKARASKQGLDRDSTSPLRSQRPIGGALSQSTPAEARFS